MCKKHKMLKPRLATAVLIAALVSVASKAQGDENLAAKTSALYPPAEWSSCESDDQCVLVWDGCRDGAINKKYLPQFQPYTACQQSTKHTPP
jgi:hypothetical protein